MHYFDNSTILLEEVEPRRALRQFFLRVVLKDLINFEPERKDYFFLLAEL